MNLLYGLAKNEDASLRATVCMEVIAMVNAVPPQASRLAQNEKKIWPEFTRYVPQVLALRRNSLWPEPPIDFDIEFAKMLSNIGCFLWHTGQIRECDLAMKTADEIIKKQPTSVGESAECKALISDINLVTGRLADCIGVSRCGVSLEDRQVLLTLREEELASISPKKVTVEDQIQWGNPKGDLACAYLQRGQFEKTCEIMEELLIYYKKWGPEDEYPFEYSMYYHHLGHVLMAFCHQD